MAADNTDDTAIRDLIHRQFASMSWKTGEGPDLQLFEDDFLAGAALFPSARPPSAQSIYDFTRRMEHLAKTSLHSFHERIVGAKVHVFGNVAVAVVACENTENEREISRNVELMLLLKDSGRWMIAAQAWDKETADNHIPTDFLSTV